MTRHGTNLCPGMRHGEGGARDQLFAGGADVGVGAGAGYGAGAAAAGGVVAAAKAVVVFVVVEVDVFVVVVVAAADALPCLPHQIRQHCTRSSGRSRSSAYPQNWRLCRKSRVFPLRTTPCRP